MKLEAFDTTIPLPDAGSSLQAYLDLCGVKHFSAREILTMRRLGKVVDAPPPAWWPRIIPTLYLAEAIREEMGFPLVVGNGYRPEPWNSKVGGAKNSQHLHFRALDLDLPRARASRDNQEEFYRVAVGLYLTAGEDMKIGLGLYRPHGGRRVHIDTGYRRRAWAPAIVREIASQLR